MSVSSLSSLSASILCQLLAEPQNGYRLKRTFEVTAMGHFSSSPGAIYPALQRMEKDGWIAGERDNPDSLRGRRVFRLTKEGRALLKAFFTSPLTRYDVTHRMDLVMLRFAFMTPAVGRTTTLAFLESLIGLLEEYLDELKAQAAAMTDAPLEGVLALGHGVESYKTHLKWARASRETLAASNN